MFDQKIDKHRVHQDIKKIYRRQRELLNGPALKSKWPRVYGYARDTFHSGFRPLHPLGPDERLYFDSPREGKPKYRFMDERHELNVLSAEATVLHCILNHAKGRLHMTKLTKAFGHYAAVLYTPNNGIPEFTMEHQAKLIGERWKEYIKEVPAVVEEAENTACHTGA